MPERVSRLYPVARTITAGLSALVLAACHGGTDDDDLSLSTHVAAGQVITLTHQASGAPGTTWRMAYRTVDAARPDHLVAVSATVIVPYGNAPAGGWPVMAWGHGSAGIGLTCAPSIQGIGGPQAAFYGAWLRAGFAVVATDFPGLGEAGTPLFLNARSEATAMLDSVRAARRAVSGLGRAVVLQGHDQGAQGALAAAGIAAAYAPELHIAGTIALAPPDPANDPDILTGGGERGHFSPSVPTALILGASLGRANPGFNPESAFTARALSAYYIAQKSCRSDVFLAAERDHLTPANALAPGAARALAPALDWARYPTLALSQPVMVAIGTADTQVPVEVQEHLARGLCAAGTAVTVMHYRGAEHTPVRARAQDDAIAFAEHALTGSAPAQTCARR